MCRSLRGSQVDGTLVVMPDYQMLNRWSTSSFCSLCILTSLNCIRYLGQRSILNKLKICSIMRKWDWHLRLVPNFSTCSTMCKRQFQWCKLTSMQKGRHKYSQWRHKNAGLSINTFVDKICWKMWVAANHCSIRHRLRTCSILKFTYPSSRPIYWHLQNSLLCLTSDQLITLSCCFLLRQRVSPHSFRSTLWQRPAQCSSKLSVIARVNIKYVNGKLKQWARSIK
jgi:hypothetical protein